MEPILVVSDTYNVFEAGDVISRRKYELTDETFEYRSVTLRRIRYLIDIPSRAVKAGDLGGFLQSEDNLSHWDHCVVLNDAKVLGEAQVVADAIVRDASSVQDKAVISGFAQVSENSTVYGNARVQDHARIYGNARVGGHAYISDFACVYSYSHVYGHAAVRGRSHVQGNSRVFDSPIILDDSRIYGNAIVSGYAILRGTSLVFHHAEVSGHAEVDDASISCFSDLMWFSHVGSEHGTLTAFRTINGDIRVTRGCFSGSTEEFLQASLKKHGPDSVYYKEYSLLVQVILNHFSASL